jgi:hypothetical protein
MSSFARESRYITRGDLIPGGGGGEDMLPLGCDVRSIESENEKPGRSRMPEVSGKQGEQMYFANVGVRLRDRTWQLRYFDRPGPKGTISTSTDSAARRQIF